MPTTPVDDPTTPDIDESTYLVSLGELKAAMSIAAGDADPVRDARLSQAIYYASGAVRDYTDRNFQPVGVTEQRSYEYDGSGFLEIDDASAVTTVTYSFSGYDLPLTSDQWRAEPFGTRFAYTYLILPTWFAGFSPEMGFTRNVDVLYREGRLFNLGPVVKVDGTWGWTTVPPAVKQAVIWTAAEMARAPQSFVSESIADYSVQTAIRGIGDPAIPDRAKELLAPYVRYKVA